MSSVYDYLEERYGKLPGDEKTLRNYIGYLIQTEKLTLNEKIRTYTKVPELPFGYQMQLDFGRVKGIGKSEAINLLDCRWIDNRGNVLFFGVATAEKGYKVCFERITNLIKLLKTAEIQKTSEYRIRRIMKSDLMIIDKIGYTPIEKREANLFFNMISEMYEKLSIIVTSNKSFDSWAEMMGDSVMTTALLDRSLHHARVFTMDGESYRIKNKNKEV